MKKSTKGALAAGAAAFLLLGGAGSLAYWTATDDVDAGTIEAGDLTLTAGTCGDWTFAAGDADGTGPATLLVPGDTIEKTCTATIDGSGDHLKATVEIDETSVADATLGNETIEVTAELTEPVGAGQGVDIDGPTAVSITITAAWDYGTEDNDSQLATDTLDAITLNAVQVHS